MVDRLRRIIYETSMNPDLQKRFITEADEAQYIPPVHIFENVYIGNLKSVRKDELMKLGITKIIIAGINLRTREHSDFDCLELRIEDTLDQNILKHFPDCISFIEKDSAKVLIHCQIGISRNSSILISYMMHKLNLEYDDAYKIVKCKYPKANPNWNFANQLRRWHVIRQNK